MTVLEERRQVIELVNEATRAGARQDRACEVLGLSKRSLQRWQNGETVGHDRRPCAAINRRTP